MSSAEFSEWIAFYRAEPFGFEWQNFVLGQLCALLAEPNRDRKVRPQPYTPSDFMYDADRPEAGSREALIASEIATLKAFG